MQQNNPLSFPSGATDPAAWGKVLSESVAQGGKVSLEGRVLSLGPKGPSTLSTKEIAHAVIDLSRQEEIKPENASYRYYDYKNLESGLVALKDKADHTAKARLFNVFGKQTSSQKAIGQAQDAVHRTMSALEDEIKSHHSLPTLLNEATKTLKQFETSEQEHPENLKKFIFHRCLDRASDNPVIEQSAKQLNGLDFGWVLDSMRREIEVISNDVKYSPEERAQLLNLAKKLEWAAKTDTIISAKMDVKEITASTKELTKEINNLKQRREVLTESIAHLDNAVKNADLSILGDFAAGRNDPDEQRRKANDRICKDFVDNLLAEKYAESARIHEEVNQLAQDPNVSKETLEKRRQEQDVFDTGVQRQKKDLRAAFDSPDIVKAFEENGIKKEQLLEALSNLKKALELQDQQDFKNKLEANKEQINNYNSQLERSIISLDFATRWITDRIENQTKAGESVMIAGGLKDHAMMFTVEPKEDGTYTFSVLNTGLGTEHHYRREDGKIQTHLRWSGLTKEQVTNPNFIRELLTFRQTEEGEDKSKAADRPYRENPIHKVYQSVMGHLGKPDPASTADEDYHKGQIHGTCTQQVTNTWMHQLLPESLYRKFKVDLTDRSLQQLERLNNVEVENPQLHQAMLEETQKIRESRAQKAEKYKE